MISWVCVTTRHKESKRKKRRKHSTKWLGHTLLKMELLPIYARYENDNNEFEKWEKRNKIDMDDAWSSMIIIIMTGRVCDVS